MTLKTFLLGIVVSLIAIELWGWIPVITRALDRLRSRIARDADEGPRAGTSDRFQERRLAGIGWSAWQVAAALGREIRAERARTEHLAGPTTGAALGVVLALSFIGSSFLLGDTPGDLRDAFQLIAAWAAVGLAGGFIASSVIGFVRSRH
jgi:hypothetical protein